MKLAAFSILLLASLGSAQATEVKCVPAESSNWRSATISDLQGAQALLQVKALGDYLVADLICSLDFCVGYLNGIEARGVIVKGANGRIASLMIHPTAKESSPARFRCQ